VEGVRGDLRPDDPTPDVLALPGFVRVKLAAPILERADQRLGLEAVLAVGWINAPLLRLLIEDAQRDPGSGPRREVDRKFLEMAQPVKDLAGHRCASKGFPGR